MLNPVGRNLNERTDTWNISQKLERKTEGHTHTTRLHGI
jgi:hypothetical protein